MASDTEPDDIRFMRAAIELAREGLGRVEPNPMVGCLLVKNGQPIGAGFHQRFGGPHAEIEALNSLDSKETAAGATAYVTLEPCCHHGKTPPCSEALIRSGVQRVVIAMRDPFPKVDGGGIAQLRDAGIEVDLGTLQSDAEALNDAYLKRVGTGRPWVIAKWAMTADGRIATVQGQSQWISGPQSRRDVHRLRSRVDAIVVGMGTVSADDPMLTARLTDDQGKTQSPHRVAKRVVLCRTRLPEVDSKLVSTATEIPTWVVASPLADPSRLDPLRAAGVNVFSIESDRPTEMIEDLLDLFGQHDMTNVMIEGGSELLGSFMHSSAGTCLIDEFHVYIGAKLFGGSSAPGPVAGDGIPMIDDAPKLTLHDVLRFENDVRLIYRKSPPESSFGRSD